MRSEKQKQKDVSASSLVSQFSLFASSLSPLLAFLLAGLYGCHKNSRDLIAFSSQGLEDQRTKQAKLPEATP